MSREKNIIDILKDHERRIAALEGKRSVKAEGKTEVWYKPGSTIEKLVCLVKEGFFNVPRAINEIISELKTKDYHLKASDITLPLRKIVHKRILRRTKIDVRGSQSKNWLYIKA